MTAVAYSLRHALLLLLFTSISGLQAQDHGLTIDRFSIETFIPFNPMTLYGISERARHHFGLPENVKSAEFTSKKPFMGKRAKARTSLVFYPNGNLKSYRHEYMKESAMLSQEYDEGSRLLVKSRRLDAGTLSKITSKFVKKDNLIDSATYYYTQGKGNKRTDTILIEYDYFPSMKIKSEQHRINTYDGKRRVAKYDFHYDVNKNLTAVTKDRQQATYQYSPPTEEINKKTTHVTDTILSMQYNEDFSLLEFRKHDSGIPIFFSTFSMNSADDVLRRQDLLTRSTYGREIEERQSYHYQKQADNWVDTRRLNQLKGRKYKKIEYYPN